MNVLYLAILIYLFALYVLCNYMSIYIYIYIIDRQDTRIKAGPGSTLTTSGQASLACPASRQAEEEDEELEIPAKAAGT